MLNGKSHNDPVDRSTPALSPQAGEPNSYWQELVQHLTLGCCKLRLGMGPGPLYRSGQAFNAGAPPQPHKLMFPVFIPTPR